MVSFRAFIQNASTLQQYEDKTTWLNEVVENLLTVSDPQVQEEVSEVLYRWGKFLADHKETDQALDKYWLIYENFPQTRWSNLVFEELVTSQNWEQMSFVPKTKFILGCEEVEKEVDPFFIDQYPTTNEQYLSFIRDTKHPPPANWLGDMYPVGKGNHPVTWVSFKDAQLYARWCGKRLPSEAEWELAARGTEDQRSWPWGDHFQPKYCNCRDTGNNGTSPIGYYKNSSPYNCYDMAGNVWEWTKSSYNTDFYILRAGSWFTYSQYANCTYRYFDFPNNSSDLYGFRCVKSFRRP